MIVLYNLIIFNINQYNTKKLFKKKEKKND
jgi:hypothetical protein